MRLVFYIQFVNNKKANKKIYNKFHNFLSCYFCFKVISEKRIPKVYTIWQIRSWNWQKKTWISHLNWWKGIRDSKTDEVKFGACLKFQECSYRPMISPLFIYLAPTEFIYTIQILDLSIFQVILLIVTLWQYICMYLIMRS